MSERDTFDRILASLHEAALDDGRWPAASALIDDALGAEGNALVVGADQPGGDVRIFYAGFFYRGERNRELEREYFDDYYARDERIPRLRKLPDSRLVHCGDLYTDEELKSSPSYNEALSRGHTQDSINVRLDGPGGSRIVWVVNDPVDTGGWSSRQIELIRRLLPHVRHYVSVRQALADAGALGSSFDELLAATGCGIIQLDWRGQIVAANDRARELLRTVDGLLDQGGRLSARWPEDDAHLRRLVARALPPYGSPGAAGSMMVRRSGKQPPLKLQVVPASSREEEFRAWPVAALVFVTHPRSRTRLNPGSVKAALGLTPAESRVAVLLAEGKTVGQIAAAVGREQSTIRTHVRHIFGKLGITRQVDLVRLVLSMGA
ncbi:MAG: helix-turn-helix transcriptional regulator [Gammaproteobacteria bacterium]|nr:helix-turn-helix transcriptional regulator [Gammaproteobacteria bacterium]MDE0258509.1 helix-turn-helix transcriptional regulator [Gammaproteobacteria bacterium]